MLRGRVYLHMQPQCTAFPSLNHHHQSSEVQPGMPLLYWMQESPPKGLGKHSCPNPCHTRDSIPTFSSLAFCRMMHAQQCLFLWDKCALRPHGRKELSGPRSKMSKDIRVTRTGGRIEGSQGDCAGAECLCSTVQEGNELNVLLFLTTSPGLLHPPQSSSLLLPHRSTQSTPSGS